MVLLCMKNEDATSKQQVEQAKFSTSFKLVFKEGSESDESAADAEMGLNHNFWSRERRTYPVLDALS